MLRITWRWIVLSLGWLALALGVVGVFMPLLPTTPFVLLAAFLFSQGSERLHRWLTDHPRFGRYVREWETEQVIPLLGKYASTVMMLPSVTWVILTRDLPWPLEALMGATMVAVLSYIWSRPSRPGRSGTGKDSKPAPAQRGLNPAAAGTEDGEHPPSRAS